MTERRSGSAAAHFYRTRFVHSKSVASAVKLSYTARFCRGAFMKIHLDRWVRRAISPLSWRVGTRRLFLAGLPVALFIWIAVLAILALAVFARGMVRPIVTFWTAPPKRSGRYYRRYAYHDERDDIIVLADRKAA